MSNRDYANRRPSGAAKPQRASRRKPSQQAPSRRLPLLLTLFVLLGVGSFGYFLWSIRDSADQAQPEPVKKAAVKQPKKDPNALPPKPKEEWTYLEELENKHVEVDVPVVENRVAKRYKLQCGSFRTASQANEMKAVIAFQGQEASVKKVSGTSGDWYKVSLGPLDGKREAEKLRHTMQRAGINGCIMLYWES
ncbi:SPOR domain-containing protein [Shewanella salipaludis]|uniref:Sporulation protein n=1 Tax=Shewanella salipaludis TaxID=2723052 RepID=A0A972JL95_9GAMM|nr:SPOR domain-containing protein [Shewanella salipaludis]NMH65197.1 sporulation protein [Shewanella salipaludis]